MLVSLNASLEPYNGSRSHNNIRRMLSVVYFLRFFNRFKEGLRSTYIYIYAFMHLADAFIQSDLQLHSGYTFLISMCVTSLEHPFIQTPWKI